jgi:hypothetical protein
MALIDIPPLSLYKFNMFGTAAVQSSTALTSGGKVGFVFQSPKSGIIDRIVWYSGTATGSPTVDVRIETVAGSSPSGTLWSGNTNVITGTLATNTEYESTLTAGASVSKGDLVGISWNYNSGTSIGIGLNSVGKSLASFLYSPQINTAGSWSVVAGRWSRCLLRFQDGTYVSPSIDSVAYGTVAQTTFFTTGEKGILFQLPNKSRLTGVWFNADIRSNVTLKLYNDATIPGGTPLLSQLIPSSAFILSGSSPHDFYFQNTQVLEPNTTYRLVAAFTSGVGTRFNLATFGSSDRRNAIVPSQYYTESSGASWIDTVTQAPVMGLIIDQIDDGAGGGGGSYSPIDNILIG